MNPRMKRLNFTVCVLSPFKYSSYELHSSLGYLNADNTQTVKLKMLALVNQELPVQII